MSLFDSLNKIPDSRKKSAAGEKLNPKAPIQTKASSTSPVETTTTAPQEMVEKIMKLKAAIHALTAFVEVKRDAEGDLTVYEEIRYISESLLHSPNLSEVALGLKLACLGYENLFLAVSQREGIQRIVNAAETFADKEASAKDLLEKYIYPEVSRLNTGSIELWKLPAVRSRSRSAGCMGFQMEQLRLNLGDIQAPRRVVSEVCPGYDICPACGLSRTHPYGCADLYHSLKPYE